jgi:uncharacterized protein (DUF305 family)
MPPNARRTGHSPNAVSAARRVRPYSRYTAKAGTLAALALIGCRGPGAGSPAHAAEPMGEAAAVARASADSARYPYTEADIRFMSGMIHHHAQAIKMARWAPTHGASAAVIRLTERIINAQTDEITLMSNWLSARRQPVPQPNPEGMTMTMGGTQHVMLMPGMLTDAQMNELDAARGEDFDRLFLTFMIQHHKGAVSMVKELFAAQGAGQDETVFKFASDVQVDQTTEINRMLEMLFALGSNPPSAPRRP